jgi:hypothetical protein
VHKRIDHNRDHKRHRKQLSTRPVALRHGIRKYQIDRLVDFQRLHFALELLHQLVGIQSDHARIRADEANGIRAPGKALIVSGFDRSQLILPDTQLRGNGLLVKAKRQATLAQGVADRLLRNALTDITQMETPLFRLCHQRHLHHDTHRDQPSPMTFFLTLSVSARRITPCTTQLNRRVDTTRMPVKYCKTKAAIKPFANDFLVQIGTRSLIANCFNCSRSEWSVPCSNASM